MTDKTKPDVSPSSTPETERVPEKGSMPRVSDTLIKAPETPDADYHAEALANAVVDNEAGTRPDSEIGGIVPLKRK